MLKLEIVTPEKKVVDETVDSVTIPTPTGEIGILTNHAPLISSLKPGILSYSNKGTNERMVIAGGFVEVSDNKVSVLADIAESSGEIDLESARSERDAVQKTLGAWSGTEEEFEAAKEELDKAEARLQLSSSR